MNSLLYGPYTAEQRGSVLACVLSIVRIAIEVTDAKSLLVTLEKLEQATLEGHLDEQLTQASNNVKARFKK